MDKQYIFFFADGKAEGNARMKSRLGGKGANLAEMTNLGLPVPPGFTISTDVCGIFNENQGEIPTSIEAEIDRNLARLESLLGRKLGDANDPLLISVRSGAKFSMPGMMDTVLNLGLNDKSVEGLARKTNNERFAYESYCLFISMFANVVLAIPKEKFDDLTDGLRKKEKLGRQELLSQAQLKLLLQKYKALVKKKAGKDFPQEPRTQLNLARDAVFRSFYNQRAIFYRRRTIYPMTWAPRSTFRQWSSAIPA